MNHSGLGWAGCPAVGPGSGRPTQGCWTKFFFFFPFANCKNLSNLRKFDSSSNSNFKRKPSAETVTIPIYRGVLASEPERRLRLRMPLIFFPFALVNWDQWIQSPPGLIWSLLAEFSNPLTVDCCSDASCCVYWVRLRELMLPSGMAKILLTTDKTPGDLSLSTATSWLDRSGPVDSFSLLLHASKPVILPFFPFSFFLFLFLFLCLYLCLCLERRRDCLAS
jgi:hypothetical protein